MDVAVINLNLNVGAVPKDGPELPEGLDRKVHRKLPRLGSRSIVRENLRSGQLVYFSERASMITTVELDVRSTDIDGDGVVNNAVYLVYFEQVRLVHLMRLGIIQRPRQAGERNFTLAAIAASFLAPLTFPEVVVASAWTARIGNTSFSLGYELVRKSDGVPVARGSSVQVWLDPSGRPTSLPPLVRQALTASLRPEGSLPS